MSKKHTYEKVKEYFEKEGYTIVNQLKYLKMIKA